MAASRCRKLMSLKYQTEDEATPDQSHENAVDSVRPDMPFYTLILIAGTAAVFVAQMVVGLNESAQLAGFVKPAFRLIMNIGES